jgi:hypothetical protein
VSRARRLPSAALAAAALLALSACSARVDDAPQTESDAAQEAASRRLLSELPHAAFIRFDESRGEGLSRETWWVEILQADRDIWLSGALRSANRAIPVKEAMSVDEFHELWKWLDSLQLDQAQLVEDAEAPASEWKRSLVIDVVESKDRRTRVRTSWSRPLLGHPEIVELEKRLQNLLIASSERELQRQKLEADSTLAARARAMADSNAAARAGFGN